MTNEEIKTIYERECERVVMEESAQSLHDYEAIDESILKFGRELVALAYEEAARLADRSVVAVDAVLATGQVSDGYYQEHEMLAAMIRALKYTPTFVQESVSS